MGSRERGVVGYNTSLVLGCVKPSLKFPVHCWCFAFFTGFVTGSFFVLWLLLLWLISTTREKANWNVLSYIWGGCGRGSKWRRSKQTGERAWRSWWRMAACWSLAWRTLCLWQSVAKLAWKWHRAWWSRPRYWTLVWWWSIIGAAFFGRDGSYVKLPTIWSSWLWRSFASASWGTWGRLVWFATWEYIATCFVRSLAIIGC